MKTGSARLRPPSGQIEGRFTSQQAADLAVVLRAGSLAILLDGQVYSAPNLQTRIGGGRGFIHRRFDAESAGDLS